MSTLNAAGRQPTADADKSVNATTDIKLRAFPAL
jgi:hypothetical protein